MIDYLLTLPAVIVNSVDSGETDIMGEPVGTVESRTDTVCEIQQASSIENRDGQLMTVSTFKGFFPADTPLTHTSVISAGGHRYTVAGRPWVARDPLLGTDSHIEALLEVVA